MKANEAPEKIYILNHTDYSDRRILNAFTEKENNNDIEYTRTDAFIEKAEEFLYEKLNSGDMECGDILKFVSDFKKHLKC